MRNPYILFRGKLISHDELVALQKRALVRLVVSVIFVLFCFAWLAYSVIAEA